jgi:hypothetical protein
MDTHMEDHTVPVSLRTPGGNSSIFISVEERFPDGDTEMMDEGGKYENGNGDESGDGGEIYQLPNLRIMLGSYTSANTKRGSVSSQQMAERL